jgi:DtxR family Mn-dependent transcriptional regulator
VPEFAKTGDCMGRERASGFSLSEANENYLKAIFELQADGSRVSTSALARRFEVAPASVTGMLKKLASESPALIDYRPRQGAELTPVGRKIALEIIRHHRLIELYLHEAMGYGWDEVHAEAERLEHVISEEFEDRLADMLGDPEYDPHGDPIPRRDGSFPAERGQRLNTLEVGRVACVVRVPGRDPRWLRRMALEGIVPGSRLRLEPSPDPDRLAIAVIDEGADGRAARSIARAQVEEVWVEAD